ncbi:MAG TPA: iron-containing alcohol dehydrogenase [Opitutaceae bacterium]|nr:iron-containing alcohol dehydrogenase [Opitutaceae bacterium]HPG17504.1 iron-containing alcohol dehydrogenase [Opitutaceae bacterium]
MRFEFATATQIVFGAGTRAEVGKLVRPWGQRALIVTGQSTARAEPLCETLRVAGVTAECFPVAGEPAVADIQRGVARAREFGAEMLLGFGGGGAIDAAKAIAGLLTNPGDPLDYLEVVGAGKPLTCPALPWLAIPTTAGTGAEVTRNAVLSVPERNVKVSLRSPHLLARIALVDPELTLDLPPSLTASTGFDALTQLLEAYVCSRTNPMTDALCAAGLPRVAGALPRAFCDGHDLAARTDMALASLWSGIALANAGLGAVHGFAGAIGGRFSAPHGAVCAALLAPVMAANLGALRARAPQHPSLARYGDVARWLTGRAEATADDGVVWVAAQHAAMALPKLAALGVAASDFAEVMAQAQQASSMKANPVVLTADELTAVLAAA